jgi:hypothetical protein
MKPQDTTDPDDRSTEVPARKAYQKPWLQVYGDLADITKTLMATMTNDGSGHPNKHFTS